MFNAIKNAFSKFATKQANTENNATESNEISNDFKTVIANSYRKQAWWIEHAAFLLELFAIALVVSWAWDSQSHWLLATICVGAFAGFEINRIHSVPLLVNAIKAKHYGMVLLGFFLVFATLLVLFAATVFENVNKADDGVNEKVLSSPAMKALELEIKQTNERISGLAEFSNPTKAHAEMQDLKSNEQARLAKIEKLKSEINTLLSSTPKNKQGESAGNSLTALTNGCKANNWYATAYCGQVQQKLNDLKSLEGNHATSEASYNKKYDEYNGLQTHLTSLEKRRAELLTSQGEGVINAYKPEDTLLASLFGMSAQNASFIKWLVFSAVLDLLGLGGRFLASMARFRASGVPDVNEATREHINKLKAFATLYGINGLQDLFDRQTQVIYHNTPALTAPAAAMSAHTPVIANVETQPAMRNGFEMTAKTDTQPQMIANAETQPVMQSGFEMTAKTETPPQTIAKVETQPTIAKTPEIFHVVSDNNKLLIIPLSECDIKLRPLCLDGKNGNYELPTCGHPYANYRNLISIKDKEPIKGKFVNIRFDPNFPISIKTETPSDNCLHYYLNVLACKAINLDIESDESLLIAEYPSIEEFTDFFSLTQRFKSRISVVGFSIDKNGYWETTISFDEFELSELGNQQREHLERVLTTHGKLKAFKQMLDKLQGIHDFDDDDDFDESEQMKEFNESFEEELEEWLGKYDKPKKQGFIGFTPPEHKATPKPKASDDSQVLGYAENPTNVVDTNVVDTNVVNTNIVYTSVVGDVATCPTCGNTFTRRNKRHKYCCEECRVKGHGFESKRQMMRTMGKTKKTSV